MPIYLWQGTNRKNEKKKGEIEAASVDAVRANLTRMQIVPTKIKAKPKDLFENVSFLQPKVTVNDIIIFARQFSTMIDAGLPILQCLEILQSQQENKTFKGILKEIKETVESGSTFADSLKRHPKQFDDLFVHMIAAGEAGGILDTILKRLSGYLEKAADLKRKVKGALIYPAITFCVAIGVTIVILLFVIPTFQEMFSSLGGNLPGPTLVVVAISEFFQNNIGKLIIAGIIIVYAFRRYYKTENGKAVIDRITLKLPIFGILLRKVAVARFTRTMGTMLTSGVPILNALDITAKTSGNKSIESAIYSVRSAISEGQTMADPLIETEVFPPMVCSMIAVGESTGALDTMMVKIADFYDEEVDQAVANLMTMIEPLMMVFLGVVVGGLLVAMYLPIFTMMSGI